jgi:hypothetical protein
MFFFSLHAVCNCYFERQLACIQCLKYVSGDGTGTGQPKGLTQKVEMKMLDARFLMATAHGRAERGLQHDRGLDATEGFNSKSCE